jgi:hypothetical protein
VTAGKVATTADVSSVRREARDGQIDRRTLLRRLVGLGALAWAGVPGPSPLGCSGSEPTCYDPGLLSTAERSARKLRGYVDHSPEGDAKRCGGCAFFESGKFESGKFESGEFESGESEDCGHCKILGGPVSAMGLCGAWAEKTAS